jgi:hypothetical protein
MSEHVLFGIVWAAAVVGMAGAWRVGWVGGYNRGLGDGEGGLAGTCDWGDCDEPANGWRDGLPVCARHGIYEIAHEPDEPTEAEMLEWTAELRAALEPGPLEGQWARDALEPGEAWLARMQDRSDDDWEAMA